jgi:hypothetical protein
MEQNKNKNNQGTNMQRNNQQGSGQQMQHRSDAVNKNTQNGDMNPQDGSEWSNYRERSLSTNKEHQHMK